MNNQNNYAKRKPYSNSNQNIQRDADPIIKELEIPPDYLTQAEKLMYSSPKITTSKIRRLYCLVTEIYDEERLRSDAKLSEKNISAVAMVRVRMAYEAGRDSDVKNFVKATHLLEYLKGIKDNRENFLKFTQYMEALVAYHKYYGGKEN